jgi:hypothetical protein
MQRVVDEVTALGADYIVKADLSLKELAGRVEKRLAVATPPAPAPVPAAPPGPRPLAVAPVRQPVRPPAPGAPTAPPEPPAPAPVDAAAPAPPAVKEKEPRILPEPRPVKDSETVECAACGSTIGINFTFCPKCGRPLSGPKGGRSWRPLSR